MDGRAHEKGRTGFLGGLFHRQTSAKKGLGSTAPGALSYRAGRELGGVSNADRLTAISPVTAEALVAAMDHLRATSLELEGLYRVSGSKVEVDRLKEILKMGAPLPKNLLEQVQDKHQIAGAIKKVLQEHQPLLTYDLYDHFLAVGGSQEGPETPGGTRKEEAYQELVDQLPPVSKSLLTSLIVHVRKVASCCVTNKMTVENLAATIGVNLLRKSEAVEAVSVQRLEFERRVVIDLIRSTVLFTSHHHQDATAGKSTDGSVRGAGPRLMPPALPNSPPPAIDDVEADVYRRTIKVSWRSGDRAPTESEVREAMAAFGELERTGMRSKSTLVMFKSKEDAARAARDYTGPWRVRGVEPKGLSPGQSTPSTLHDEGGTVNSPSVQEPGDETEGVEAQGPARGGGKVEAGGLAASQFFPAPIAEEEDDDESRTGRSTTTTIKLDSTGGAATSLDSSGGGSSRDGRRLSIRNLMGLFNSNNNRQHNTQRDNGGGRNGGAEVVASPASLDLSSSSSTSDSGGGGGSKKHAVAVPKPPRRGSSSSSFSPFVSQPSPPPQQEVVSDHHPAIHRQGVQIPSPIAEADPPEAPYRRSNSGSSAGRTGPQANPLMNALIGEMERKLASSAGGGGGGGGGHSTSTTLPPTPSQPPPPPQVSSSATSATAMMPDTEARFSRPKKPPAKRRAPLPFSPSPTTTHVPAASLPLPQQPFLPRYSTTTNNNMDSSSRRQHPPPSPALDADLSLSSSSSKQQQLHSTTTTTTRRRPSERMSLAVAWAAGQPPQGGQRQQQRRETAALGATSSSLTTQEQALRELVQLPLYSTTTTSLGGTTSLGTSGGMEKPQKAQRRGSAQTLYLPTDALAVSTTPSSSSSSAPVISSPFREPLPSSTVVITSKIPNPAIANAEPTTGKDEKRGGGREGGVSSPIGGKDALSTIKALRAELEEQRQRCRHLETKLRTVEDTWEAELQDIKSSNTLSRDALDRLTQDLAIVKSHLLNKDTEVSGMVREHKKAAKALEKAGGSGSNSEERAKEAVQERLLKEFQKEAARAEHAKGSLQREVGMVRNELSATKKEAELWKARAQTAEEILQSQRVPASATNYMTGTLELGRVVNTGVLVLDDGKVVGQQGRKGDSRAGRRGSAAGVQEEEEGRGEEEEEGAGGDEGGDQEQESPKPAAVARVEDEVLDSSSKIFAKLEAAQKTMLKSLRRDIREADRDLESVYADQDSRTVVAAGAVYSSARRTDMPSKLHKVQPATQALGGKRQGSSSGAAPPLRRGSAPALSSPGAKSSPSEKYTAEWFGFSAALPDSEDFKQAAIAISGVNPGRSPDRQQSGGSGSGVDRQKG